MTGLHAQKSPDVRVDTGTGPGAYGSSDVQVAAVGSTVHAVWRDYRNGRNNIYYTRSADGGATWPSASESRVDAGNPYDSDEPQIVAAGLVVHIAWLDGRSGTSRVFHRRSVDGGVTWSSPPQDIDLPLPSGTYSLKPRLAVDGALVAVVWMGHPIGSPDIYCNRSVDGGATWLPAPVRVSTGVAAGTWPGCWVPQVAVSGAVVAVVWIDNRFWPAPAHGFANRSLDAGMTWLPTAVDLGVGGGWIRAAFGSGALHVVHGSACGVSYQRSLDQGATWLSAPACVSSSSAAVDAASLAVDGASVHVAWVDGRNGGPAHEDIYFNRSVDGGITWLPADVRLDTATPLGAQPSGGVSVAVHGAAVTACWHERIAGIWGIRTNRSSDGGLSWLSQDLALSHGAADALWPRGLATGGGVLVAWSDYRNGNTDIYFNLASGSQPYGVGLAGTSGLTPQLATAGPAMIGATFSIELSRGLGGAFGLLGLGLGPTTRVAVPLLGGTLLVAPDVTLPLLLTGALGNPGAGTATTPFPVPASTSFLGTNVNCQAAVLDAAAAQSFALSNAIEIWIG